MKACDDCKYWMHCRYTSKCTAKTPLECVEYEHCEQLAEDARRDAYYESLGFDDLYDD